jgi:hypothetical protein
MLSEAVACAVHEVGLGRAVGMSVVIASGRSSQTLPLLDSNDAKASFLFDHAHL